VNKIVCVDWELDVDLTGIFFMVLLFVFCLLVAAMRAGITSRGKAGKGKHLMLGIVLQAPVVVWWLSTSRGASS
jgi:hypothetical protein